MLARKWRPQTFSDLVGQDHVVKALINGLQTGRLHHAYLFTGIRGVGKTTIARILAKSLNCETGVTATPCGECSICTDINAGRFFDLIEVDAASNNGVDDTRELLENAQYKPTSGRYKVYLIDEVHMFSRSSFNALLKTLEEPPEHVKFLLATTEANKLPATVLSRCVQFNLKSMSVNVLTDHLARILGEEKIDYEEGALQYVARVADGSVRDSLSLIEQVAALGEGKVQVSVVEQLLGVLSPDRVLELLQLVAAGDAAGCLAHTRVVDEFSPDYRQLLADILSVFHQVAVHQLVPESATALDRWDRDAVLKLSSALSPEHVQLCYDLVLQGQRDMQIAPHPRESFEMTLLRMMFFKPATIDPESASASAATPRKSETASSENAAAAPAAAAPKSSQVQQEQSAVSEQTRDAVTAAATSASTATSNTASNIASTERKAGTPEAGQQQGSDTEVRANGAVGDTSANAASNTEAKPVNQQPETTTNTPIAPMGGAVSAPQSQAKPPLQSAQATAIAPSHSHGVAALPEQKTAAEHPVTEAVQSTGDTGPENDSAVVANQQAELQQYLASLKLSGESWLELAEKLPLKGMAAELAANTGFLSYENGRLAISIEAPHEELNRPLARGQFEQALKRVGHADLMLEIVTGEHSMETLAQKRLRLRQEAQLAAEASIADDPVVRKLIDRTDGEVVKDSIQPVAAKPDSEIVIQRTAEISE